MQGTQSILDYYKDQEKEFLKHFPKARDKNDEEAIHDMRVAIKKIRAYFDFLENTSEHIFKSKINYLFFGKIFKASGKIRDLQLQQKIIIKESKSIDFQPTEYIEHLKIEQRTAEARFIKTLKSTDFNNIEILSKQIRNTLKSIDNNAIQKRAHNFLLSKFGKISFLSKMPVENEKWHDIRTQVKQSLYILELMSRFFGTNNYAKDLQNDLKKFGEQLGNWHDKDMSYVNLKSYLESKKFSGMQKKQYCKLLKALSISC